MLKMLTMLLLVLSSVQIFAFDPFMMITEETSLEEAKNLFQAFSEITEKEKELAEVSFSLDLKEVGTYKLSQSHSRLSIPDGYQLLIGEEAKKWRKISCQDPENPHLEAAVYYGDLGDVILFEHYKEGYVSLDDWGDLDPNSLLKSISENTEKENKERRKNGGEELHVVGWIQEPVLDKQTNTVYWVLEGEIIDQENNKAALVNSVAIRLGREGFEKLIWATSKESYVPFGGHLDVMLQSHSFDIGYRYEDYETGDRIASYGLAALVAVTVGGKLSKAGGGLLFLKKIGGLFAGISAFFYKFKNRFSRKKRD